MSMLAIVFTFSIIFSMNVMASSRRETINLQKNQVWNVREYVTRSQQSKYVSSRCYGVYPTKGSDNYRYIQAVARNVLGKAVTDTCKLDERATSETLMQIHEGSLDISQVIFAFRGNDPDYPARADVYYSGK